MTYGEFPIELVGGPKDGERWCLKEDLPQIRFAGLAEPERMATESGEEIDPPHIYYIQYLRTRHIHNGHRIYTFYNPRRFQ